VRTADILPQDFNVDEKFPYWKQMLSNEYTSISRRRKPLPVSKLPSFSLALYMAAVQQEISSLFFLCVSFGDSKGTELVH
jgi:hypothetical protein